MKATDNAQAFPASIDDADNIQCVHTTKLSIFCNCLPGVTQTCSAKEGLIRPWRQSKMTSKIQVVLAIHQTSLQMRHILSGHIETAYA